MSQLPYPGLRPFQRDEADIFFGRDEQVQQLLDKLQGKRFLAVVGQSGCGKSSLIFTGLLNALDAGMLPDAGLHWRIASLHPGEHPMLNLAKALVEGAGIGSDNDSAINYDPDPSARAAASDTGGDNTVRHDPAEFLLATLRRGPLGLVEALREQPMSADTNLLILVDQFEEIFRYRKHHDRDEADAFIALLLRTVSESLANADGFPVYVVITMRSDFLGDCALFPGLPEALNDSQFLTPRLTREQRRMAIIGPAKVFGGDVEPALVNRLLNDMGADPDQLPVLQHALMRLWSKAVESGDKPVLLKLKDYEELGGWDHTLSNHADAAYNELIPGQQAMAETLFKALSERSAEKRDTRRPATMQTLAGIAQVKPEDLVPVIEVFRASGRSFIKPSPPQALTLETLIDISHESLIRQWQTMKEWVNQEAKSADTYRRLEQTALLHESNHADYLKGLELAAAIKWKQQTKPNAEWAKRYGQDFKLAMQFMDGSEVREKLKYFGKILLLAGVVATAMTMAYLKQEADTLSHKAENDRLKADQLRKLEEAGRFQDKGASYFLTGALLAIEAEKIFPEPSEKLNKFLLNSIGMMEKPLKTMNLANEVRLAVYSYEGKWLATVDGNATVRLWDALAPKDQALFSLNHDHDHSVTAIKFSPDEQKLATVSDDKIVRLWNVANGDKLLEFKHGGKVNSLDFNNNGRILAAGCDDKYVYLWDTASGERLNRLPHGGPVKSVSFNEKLPNYLATASLDNKTRIWDIAVSKKEIKQLDNEDVVNAVSFSKDGTWLATANNDKKVKLWKVAATDGTLIKESVEKGNEKPKDLHHDYAVSQILFSPDSRWLAASTDDGKISLWSTDSDKVKPSLELVHGNYITSFGFSPDSQNIASASNDSTARIWSIYNNIGGVENREIKRLYHDGTVNAVSFRPDGLQLATASTDKTAKFWSATGGQEFKHLTPDIKARSIAFIPHAQQFVVLNKEKDNAPISISLKNLDDGRVIRHFNLNVDLDADSYFDTHNFSADGRRLAVVGKDETVHILNIADGKEVEVNLEKQSVKTNVAKFSPDGQKILTVNDDNQTALIWDAVTGKVIGQLRSDSGYHALSFSPDGKWLATGHQNKSIELWDLASFKKMNHFKEVCDVYDIDVTQGTNKIAVACADNSVRLLDIDTNKEGDHLQHEREVTKVRFSPDGMRLLTASGDNTVRLWDVADGSELQTMQHAGRIRDIAFSLDGKKLMTIDKDDVIRFWHWQPEDLVEQLCGILSLNLGWEDWQDYFKGQPYRKTCDKLSIDRKQLTETGRKLIVSGKKEEAERMIEVLNSTYPDLKLDPVREIKIYSASQLFEEAQKLKNDNKIKEASAKYYQVEALDNTVVTAYDWNLLCWAGAIQQAAAEVKNACENAVNKASDNDELFMNRDSRGIVRALTNDYEGAISDFEFFIREAGSQKFYANITKQRQEWIKALKAGTNPITARVLESIKDQ